MIGVSLPITLAGICKEKTITFSIRDRILKTFCDVFNFLQRFFIFKNGKIREYP